MFHFSIVKKGKPDQVLQLVEGQSVNQLNTGQIRIRTVASSVLFQDAAACLTPSATKVPGHEFAGIVTETTIPAFPIGSEVMGWTSGGGLASEIIVPYTHLVLKPAALSWAAAAALPQTYVAAWQLLQVVVPLEKTNRIFIQGGAGALGTALTAMGRYLGIEIYATADARYHQALHLLGASPINYQAEDFVRAVKRLSIDGAHAAYDCLGGTLSKSFETLRPKGVLVSTGYLQDERVGRSAGSTLTDLSIRTSAMLSGKHYVKYSVADPALQSRWHQDLVHVLTIAMSGRLEIALAPTIKTSQVAAAMNDMLQLRAPFGKTILLWDQAS